MGVQWLILRDCDWRAFVIDQFWMDNEQLQLIRQAECSFPEFPLRILNFIPIKKLSESLNISLEYRIKKVFAFLP